MLQRGALLFLLLQAGLGAAHHAQTFSLDGAWTVKNANGSYHTSAQVPGGIYTDLRKGGILEQDIFYRFNDEEYRWVSKDTWIYSRSFRVPEEARSREHQVLVFHGVDTVATIYLNGQRLGSTDNMFVRYRFDVKSVLLDGDNLLEVHFSSPVEVAADRAREQAKQYVVPPLCVPPDYHGECGVNYLRKMQASFAWDWGPAFPSVGLWKSVELETYNGPLVRSVSFAPIRTGFGWCIKLIVFYETGFSGAFRTAQMNTTLRDKAGRVLTKVSWEFKLQPSSEGEGEVAIYKFLDSPTQEPIIEWWPNGMGAQYLYDMETTLVEKGLGHGEPYKQRVGFRTVDLVEDPVDPKDPTKGLTFFFRVNGVDMFAKGSNWIPAHILPELGGQREVVSHLLQSARETHMNMLRVWGGGVYESDYFYQVADELGILIWQDFMFACAMYPTNPDFLTSVRKEVAQQVRRLNHHPSIAIWSGNNENEAALRGNWYRTADNFSIYLEDYVKLYVDTVRDEVRSTGSPGYFLVSSPTNGRQSEAEGFVASNPYSPLYGDDHHYDYVSDGWNPAVYHHTRFGSEYGFQSLPSLETMKMAAQAKDLALGSKFSNSRQHHPGGNLEIALEIERNLPLRPVHNDTDYYPVIVYLSQINQAMSTKTETEFLRRARSLLTPRGEGRTMGALYWQLNDVWQAPSWSSIDFAGRWKMLHYFALDFFAPVLVSPTLTASGKVFGDVVSDLPGGFKDRLDLFITVIGWDAFEPRLVETQTFQLTAPGTFRVWTADIDQLIRRSNCESTRDCFLWFQLKTAANAEPVGPPNFIFPEPIKNANLRRASVKVTNVTGPFLGSQHQRYDYELHVQASAPAAFTWLEALGLTGRFSRNGFHLVNADEKLRFHTDEEISAEALQKAISVTCVNDLRYSHDGQPGGAAVQQVTELTLVLALAVATFGDFLLQRI